MKKAGAILLAAAMSVTMVAGLAACGGNGNGGDTATEKVVKVWLHKSKTEDEGKTYASIEELFNEADYKTKDGRDIVMRIEYKSNADQLKTAITSEMGMGGAGLPDIIAVDAPDIASYADSRAGILVPIDEYVTAEEKADYVDSVIEQSTVGGKLYALSGADAPAGLYYNKEALTAAGIAPGTVEEPWSWNDLAENIQKLKAAGKPYKIQLSLGFGGNEGLMYLYAPLVYSADGEFADASGLVKSSLTSANSIAGLTSFADFMKKAKADASDIWSYSGTAGDAAFPTQEVAFMIYGPWMIRTIRKNYASFADKYDIMPYPVFEDANGNKGDIVTPCGSWGFGVTKAARDADAAAQVVKYLTGAEASEMLYTSIGTFPTHKSVLGETEDFESGPLHSLAVLLTDTAKARPKIVNYAKLRDAYAKIIDYINNHATESAFDLAAYVTQEANGVD